MSQTKKPTPWTLYGIFFTFLAPIFLAYSLYFGGYGKSNRVNKGRLLHAPGISLKKALAQYPRQWFIAKLDSSRKNTQQIETVTKRWVALGKERHRVGLIHLITSSTDGEVQLPWTTVTINKTQLLDLEQNKCTYFLVDPNHHAILCYDSDVDPRDIDTDLRKLLKYSRNG